MCGCETQILTKDSERKLRCFEGKVLKTIFGLTIDPTIHLFRMQKNKELSEMYQDCDIMSQINGMRPRWVGPSNGCQNSVRTNPIL